MSHKDTSIVLLGEWGVGKSSMLAAHLSGCAQVKTTPSTIGMSFCMLEPTSLSLPSGIACWDTAGQERYRALIPMYTRNAGAFICLVPSTSPRDHDSARDNIIASLTTTLQDGGSRNLIHIALVMSKCDVGGNVDDILSPLKTAVSNVLQNAGSSARISCHECSSLNPASCTAVFTHCMDAIKDHHVHDLHLQSSITRMQGLAPPQIEGTSCSQKRKCC